MVRPVLGGAVAGFTAAIVALAAAGLIRSGWGLASAATPATEAGAAPAVQCAPHEQAVLDRLVLNGRETNVLRCAPRIDDRMVYYPPQPYAQAYPSATYVSQPMYPAAPAAAPAVQRRPAANRAAERVVYVDREEDVRRRSWAKTALILGGSAGTGAGIGAIAGGKKGALIGAAIGGGAASIYEATKR